MSDVKNVVYTNSSTSLCTRDLLRWVNQTLDSEFAKIEELCTGAAYCQLTDMLFPNVVAMKRVKFTTNVEYDFLRNYKILQAAFNDMGVDQTIPVERLVRGHLSDNMQFLQWFYMFFEANFNGKEYDPRAARKGAPMAFGPDFPVGKPNRSRSVPKVAMDMQKSNRRAKSVSKTTKDLMPIDDLIRKMAELKADIEELEIGESMYTTYT